MYANRKYVGCVSISYDLPTRAACYSRLTRPCRWPMVSK